MTKSYAAQLQPGVNEKRINPGFHSVCVCPRKDILSYADDDNYLLVFIIFSTQFVNG